MTRADLPPAVQAVQSAHAAVDFTLTWPEKVPETLVLLAVADEDELRWLYQEARLASLTAAASHEPDLDDQLTAVALEPAAARLVRRYPLAFTGRG